jgi:hypothetical protein
MTLTQIHALKKYAETAPCTLHKSWGLAVQTRFGEYRRSWDSCVGTNGGGFPNRRTKLPGNLALILQDLSLAAFTFSEL